MDILLKGLTDDDLREIDAAVERDGAASRSAWIRDTLLAGARGTMTTKQALAVVTRAVRSSQP